MRMAVFDGDLCGRITAFFYKGLKAGWYIGIWLDLFYAPSPDVAIGISF